MWVQSIAYGLYDLARIFDPSFVIAGWLAKVLRVRCQASRMKNGWNLHRLVAVAMILCSLLKPTHVGKRVSAQPEMMV